MNSFNQSIDAGASGNPVGLEIQDDFSGSAVATLHSQLIEAFALPETEVVIRADNVTNAGTLAVQLLVAAQAQAIIQGRRFRLAAVSPALSSVSSRLGICLTSDFET